MRKYLECLLIAALLIPLLFINIRNSHDWGDDFAQYIHQARNIHDGISQDKTNYVFNPDAFLGPPAYPSGFPLLLAPVVGHYGISFHVLDLYQSLFLLGACLIGFLILRRSFSFATSLFSTLIIAYNPVSLQFKTEVLSDLPFMFFSMLALWMALFKSRHLVYAMCIGFTIGFSCHIRSIAVVLLIAVLLQEFFNARRISGTFISRYRYALVVLGAYVVSFLAIGWLFPTNSSYEHWFETDKTYITAINHLSYHNEALHRFFRDYEVKDYFFIACISASCLTAFGLYGFLLSLKRNRLDLVNLYVLGYIVVIMAYKYGDTGLRFVYPILFFVFCYAITGLKAALLLISQRTAWMPYVFGIIVLFSYTDEIRKIREHSAETMEGPCTESSQQTFAFIREHTTAQDTIAFEKARALALYTDRPGVCLKGYIPVPELMSQVKHFHCRYILTNVLLTPGESMEIISHDTTHFKHLYNNGAFTFYQVRL